MTFPLELEATIVRPASDAGCAGRTTRHNPSTPEAVAFSVCPAKLTSTTLPGVSKPHIGAGRSRWSTMWLPKVLEKCIEAAGAAATNSKSIIMAKEGMNRNCFSDIWSSYEYRYCNLIASQRAPDQ